MTNDAQDTWVEFMGDHRSSLKVQLKPFKLFLKLPVILRSDQTCRLESSRIQHINLDSESILRFCQFINVTCQNLLVHTQTLLRSLEVWVLCTFTQNTLYMIYVSLSWSHRKHIHVEYYKTSTHTNFAEKPRSLGIVYIYTKYSVHDVCFAFLKPSETYTCRVLHQKDL